MGRWTRQDATVCIFGTVNCAFGENTSDARRIVNTHNADCDAYEARIAEMEAELDNANAIATWVDGLQSELARVKAESLRVVEDGEACDVCQCKTQYFLDEDNELYECSPEVVGDCRDVRHFINGMEGFFSDVRVQPVRLERWETSE